MIGRGECSSAKPTLSSVSIVIFLLLCISSTLIIDAENTPEGDNHSPVDNASFLSPALSPDPPPTPAIPKYNPRDNILIACGAGGDVILPDGRTFKSDPSTATYLNTDEDVKANVDSNNEIMGLPLYKSARVFPNEATYRFPISEPGFHFIRLYFYPLAHPSYNLNAAVFRVTTDNFVFLHDFSVSSPNPVFKEYLLNITSEKLTLKFSSKKNSIAFINAIEVVSVPDNLISDIASSVPPTGDFTGVSSHALEVSYRVNVGGPLVSPMNDTLWRTWVSDESFNTFPQGSKNVSISPRHVKYPSGGATPFIAPPWVYATADEMAESNTMTQNFNMTWRMSVDPSYDYLIRLHFCDIVSTVLSELFFNVYVNGLMGASSLDLSSLTTSLSTAYYRDFVLNSTVITNGSVVVQVGPASGSANAILNGVEVIKMSNSAGSLNGLFNADGNYMGTGQETKTMKTVAVLGLMVGLTAMILVGSMFRKWQKRPQGWEKHNSFSSWLLPISSSHNSFLSNKSFATSSKGNFSLFGSRKCSSIVPSTNKGVGKFFSFNELQEATKNFDEEEEIGVGGFGKVYLGQLQDGTKVAVKRGNPQSEQGINEFQTEIQMLSQLRHRHLVSLIGYCDEGTEMCLVYEYMSNGVLREHLYGSKLKLPLTWKQRLDICIGSARGLHYLHTGAAHCIIHRDVKTTNILLDEKLVAKVSDFGLSKAACLLEQTHVSTAVKGSFGYLDPEYFKRQQLTEKSDVYSFGVVLFEVLTARPAINPALPREQVNLAEWGMSNYRKGLLQKIIDPNLQGTINDASLKKFVEAAEKCLAEYGVDRPSMGDVLWNLEYALQLQQASDTKAEQPEDNSALMIPMEMVPMMAASDAAAIADDNTEVAVTSFSEIANFQGR